MKALRVSAVALLALVLAGAVITVAVDPFEVPRRAGDRAPTIDSTAFVMPDGSRLPFRAWGLAAVEEPRAIVVALHGGGYHAQWMAPLGEYLAQRNNVVTYAYDQRGHGGAPGFGDWHGAALMTEDLAHVVRLLRERHPGTAIYVAGLSFGASVVLSSVGAEAFPPVEGAILIAPGLERSDLASQALRRALGVAARLFPHATFPAPADPGTYIGEYAERSEADPLVMKEMKLHYAYAGIEYLEETVRHAPRLTVPTLVLYGRRDAINPESAVIDLFERLGGRKRLIVYPEGHHVLLWDERREVVLRDIDAWLRDHDGPLPSLRSLPPTAEEYTGTIG